MSKRDVSHFAGGYLYDVCFSSFYSMYWAMKRHHYCCVNVHS